MEERPFVGFQLSPFQQLLWSTQSGTPLGSFCRVLIEGGLDADRLKSALETVALRHESLRTSFQQPPGSAFPFQVIADTPEIAWESAETASEADPAPIFGDGPTLRAQLNPEAAGRHVLALRASALCADTASMRNLIEEVASFYKGEPTADEPVQYADFSGWHLELLSATGTEAYQAAKQHWSEPRGPQRLPFEWAQLEGTAGPLKSYGFPVDSGLLAAIAGKVPEILFASWQALLHRLTGQESVTVSYLSDGRASAELQGSIGLFAHPVPVTCGFGDNPSFEALSIRSKEALATADQWQYYTPVAGALEPGFGFEFQQLSGKSGAGDLGWSLLQCSPSAWPNKISLVCASSAAGLDFHLSYASGAFCEADVARLARYFERTLRAAVETPGASVSSFDLLDEAERGQALAASAGEVVDFHNADCFHQLFERQAALTPDRLALVFDQTEFTYSQLSARANQIAHYLRQFGVGPNVRVGLCLDRSAEMIVAVLGILKAGGAYVPLLPDMPKVRLAHQLAETEAPAVITVEALIDKLPGFAGRVLCLDRDSAELEKKPQSDLEHSVTSDDLIYVLYTSGSTGTPKGVEVRHGNVTNYTLAMCNRLGLNALSTDPAVTFASVSTLGADLGNTSIFPPLVTGGCLCILGYDAALDARIFALRNRQHPIDVLKITPSNITALMLSGSPKEVLPRKMLIVGGEACSWDLVRRVHQSGGCAMMNHYGPTETTVGCLTYPIAKENDPAESWAATVPLGRPIPNLQVYVLDTARRLVPAGVAGEICISGAGVTNGYIGRPGETSLRFVPHPFLAGGTPLYCTGDRGRVLSSGAIEFLGRMDEQVKIRGHRVELGEIEAVLHKHAGVKQAVALLSQDDTGQHLTAYVVADPAPPAGVLEKYLSERLPEYMVPGRIVAVDQFPLNANGKLDRRKLAELSIQPVKPAAGSAAPRNATEEQLVNIWKEVLKTDRVGIADNFFELGGHSLLATLVVSRVRAVFGVQISIRALFESPTVESLAQAVEQADKETVEDPDIADLLSEMEGLSDEETLQLLDAEVEPNSLGAGKN